MAVMCERRELHGRLPSSYDWSPTRARWRGGEALERLAVGVWPSASVVTSFSGTWAAARAAALWHDVGDPGLGMMAWLERVSGSCVGGGTSRIGFVFPV
jgi:hypothetical protein